jgi:hypothetical protein
MSSPDDSWPEWSRHVLAELKRLNDNLANLDDKIDTIKDGHISPLKIEIAMLKVKSGIWGLIGGAIPVILMVLVELLKK